ncbi:MAG: hypothetical protein ACK5NB_00710 [Flavobacteriaceae bacterium]
MKPKFYITLFFLISFSFAKAQNTNVFLKVENNKISSVSVLETQPVKVFKNVQGQLTNNEVFGNSASVSFSDLRLYLNRERKIDNLSVLFPKAYKEAKA